jgi:glycosyltransferase involved in cell wall biosynthesis
MQKQSVTIGIPAFNEENNIKDLIFSLISYDKSARLIKTIIVSSDGSIDSTVSEAKKVSDKRIKVIDNKDRIGIQRGLNQVIKKADTQFLIILDADIKIKDPMFVEKIIEPLQKNQSDMTSNPIVPLPSVNLLTRILSLSMSLKEILFRQINNGDNIYSCHGPVRAYSSRLYKDLTFKTGAGNDMYSYLDCKNRKFRFKYVTNTEVYFKLPISLKDHLKQSVRFYGSMEKQAELFPGVLVKRSFRISLNDYLVSIIKSIPLLVRNPVETIGYIFLSMLTFIWSKFKGPASDMWNVSVSSKDLRK